MACDPTVKTFLDNFTTKITKDIEQEIIKKSQTVIKAKIALLVSEGIITRTDAEEYLGTKISGQTKVPVNQQRADSCGINTGRIGSC